MRSKAISVRVPETILTALYAGAKRKRVPLSEHAKELMAAGMRADDLAQVAERLTAIESQLVYRMTGVEKLLAAALWKLLETAEWSCHGRPADEVARVRDETGKRVIEHTRRLLGRDILD